MVQWSISDKCTTLSDIKLATEKQSRGFLSLKSFQTKTTIKIFNSRKTFCTFVTGRKDSMHKYVLGTHLQKGLTDVILFNAKGLCFISCSKWGTAQVSLRGAWWHIPEAERWPNDEGHSQAWAACHIVTQVFKLTPKLLITQIAIFPTPNILIFSLTCSGRLSSAGRMRESCSRRTFLGKAVSSAVAEFIRSNFSCKTVK